MLPHLVRWHDRFAKQGLVILDVDNGKRDSLEILRRHVEEKKIPYAVAFDEGAKTCAAYGIRGYPASFLIGVDGKVIWEGFPLPEVETVERLIEEEVAKVKMPEEKPAEEGGAGDGPGAQDGSSGGG